MNDSLDSPPGTRGNANYGRALPDERLSRSTPRVTPRAERFTDDGKSPVLDQIVRLSKVTSNGERSE